MPSIASTLDVGGSAFAENRAAMLGLLARVRGCEARTAAASAAARPRFEQRGQLRPRVGQALEQGFRFAQRGFGGSVVALAR